MVLRDMLKNVLKGVGLGLFIATGFTAWITFLRQTAGTAPFDRLHTTYSATVALYYGSGLIGGVIVGLLLPLFRWPLGAALVGMMGVFPAYFGVALTTTDASHAFTRDNVADSAVCAFLVGGTVGIWAWIDDNPKSSGWIDALRHPTSQTVGKVWALALGIATPAYFGLSRWTGSWSPQLVTIVAFVLFVIPLGLAALVTIVWTRASGRRGDT